MPFFTSSNWMERRTAAAALFVLVESCNEEMSKSISDFCNAMRGLLHDSCHAVSRKASFFFSEICDYLEEQVLQECDWLMSDISEVMLEEMYHVANSFEGLVECREWINSAGECFTDIW